MKKLILAVIVAMAFSGLAFAGEFERNPDRFPSLGLTMNFAGQSGTSTSKFGGTSAEQNIHTGDFGFILDLRAPVSQSLSLFGAIGLIGSSVVADETSILSGNDIKGGGLGLSLGLRYYFNQ